MESKIRKIIREALVLDDEFSGMHPDWKEKIIAARQETLLGKPIKELLTYEDGEFGFVLDDGSILKADDSTIYYEDNDFFKMQRGDSVYGFERTYENHISGEETSIFPTKIEAKKFLHFLNKFLNERPKNLKLKYIFTPDFKLKKIPELTQEEADKMFIGKEVDLFEYDNTHKMAPVSYKIKSSRVYFEDNMYSITIRLVKTEGGDWDDTYRLNLTSFYDKFGNKQTKDEVTFERWPCMGRHGFAQDITQQPEIVALAKEIKKLITPKIVK